MMELQYKDGLLFTQIEVVFKGKHKIIQNMVVDTGAAQSIISPDIVADIDVFPEETDEIVTLVGVGGSEHYSYSKIFDSTHVGSATISDVSFDIGIVAPQGRINGLLGLDILIKIGAIIDLNHFQFK